MPTPPAGRRLALALRLYAWLLRAYPPRFRHRFGPEMTQALQDGWHEAERQAGVRGALHWWLLALLDLVHTALGERLGALAQRRREMNDRERTFESAAPGPAVADRAQPGGTTTRRAMLLLVGLGLLWGILVQGFRDYGQGLPGLNRLDFVWIEVLGMVLLLAGLALCTPGWSPAHLGLLVAVCGSSVLIGHYGYYVVALALGAGPAVRVDVDLRTWGAYRFLWDTFQSGVGRWLLFVELGGFAAGWVWGLTLRRLRGPRGRTSAGAI